GGGARNATHRHGGEASGEEHHVAAHDRRRVEARLGGARERDRADDELTRLEEEVVGGEEGGARVGRRPRAGLLLAVGAAEGSAVDPRVELGDPGRTLASGAGEAEHERLSALYAPPAACFPTARRR